MKNTGKKARITLTIDAEVLRKAHEIGLNVSQFCENALKQAIKALERTKIRGEANGRYIDMRKNVSSTARLAGGTGFEPATPSLGGSCPILARLPALVF